MKLVSVVTLIVVLDFANGYITWLEKRYPLEGTPSPPGSPWPMPKSWIKYDALFTLDSSKFSIKADKNCSVIYEAVKRYKRHIFPHKKFHAHPDYNVLKEVHMVISDDGCPDLPRLDDDEDYSIMVTGTKDCSKTYGHCLTPHVDLQAKTVWGGLRALETFSQLIWEKDDALVINETNIMDSPRFKHRGILLDTARHFLPVSIIKKNLDAMEWNKMNVFHWHIVDDQSFPYESKRFPDLSLKGAYSPKHVYKQAEILDIIKYAGFRGIRVILEFDTPGHTMGFGKAYPELLTPCYGDGKTPGTANYFMPHADYEILDPTKNFTYEFMTDFFEEVRQVLKDDYVHLGMDEVYYNCWKSSPEIAKFMKENGYTGFHQVEQHYVEWMINMIHNQGFKYITWQDPIDSGVKMPADTIIHVWKDKGLDWSVDRWQNYMANVARKNYKIILSSCWYLNYISYGQDWKKYYECDPTNFIGTEKQKALVIGGEACLWGEYVDGTNLLSRLWPRASAVAERLWSDETVKNTDDAAFRLDEQRCRMLRRGIPAQPILNGFCDECEWQMNNNKMEEMKTTVSPSKESDPNSFAFFTELYPTSTVSVTESNPNSSVSVTESRSSSSASVKESNPNSSASVMESNPNSSASVMESNPSSPVSSTESHLSSSVSVTESSPSLSVSVMESRSSSSVSVMESSPSSSVSVMESTPSSLVSVMESTPSSSVSVMESSPSSSVSAMESSPSSSVSVMESSPSSLVSLVESDLSSTANTSFIASAIQSSTINTRKARNRNNAASGYFGTISPMVYLLSYILSSFTFLVKFQE